MISRGKYRGVYLYELTAADLLVDNVAERYALGNVVLFERKKCLELGTELACAQDLSAAQEYLDGTTSELITLRAKLAQRDDLLRELSENLTSQRETNALLVVQLEQARTQLAIEDASREELLEDLQRVSEQTNSVELTLERTMSEKYALEQELASRITDLLEVNLRCDDLQQSIEQTGIAPSAVSAVSAAASPASASITSNAATPDNQTLTMASGKQVHIYHEFGSASKRGANGHATSLAFKIIRLIIIAIITVIVIISLSIVTTATANNITPGEALNMLLNMLPH